MYSMSAAPAESVNVAVKVPEFPLPELGLNDVAEGAVAPGMVHVPICCQLPLFPLKSPATM
jgi:hypothetical protein